MPLEHIKTSTAYLANGTTATTAGVNPRLLRYELEAARKIDRARVSFVRSLVATGEFNSKAAQGKWLELLRKETAVTVQMVNQGLLFPDIQPARD